MAPTATRANSWEDVADLARSFGIVLDEWQEMVLRSAMGERTNGTWSAKQVGLSVPRQNGKSLLMVARALAGALLFGEKKIIISAHAQDTARESFSEFVALIDNNPSLSERVANVMNAINREKITFVNGATIQFKARTLSGSRGFSSDCLLLDEAQILGMPAWVSINSTMSARPNPQIWLLGTPPTPENNGEVFTRIRASALAGKSTSLAWLEWAADPKDDPSLESTRAKANPAWHVRINHEVVQGEFDSYPPDRFSLDRLGIWREDMESSVDVFGEGRWTACESSITTPEVPAALGVAVSIDREWASIAAASPVEMLPDESDPEAEPRTRWFVGAVDRREGTGWLVAELKRIQQETGCLILMDEKGPASDLIDTFLDADVAVEPATLGEYIDACSFFYDGVKSTDIAHPSSQELNEAVSGAAWRPVGDRQVWGRRKSTTDISMLEAATFAVHGAAKFGAFTIH